jgi:hypothetical protein
MRGCRSWRPVWTSCASRRGCSAPSRAAPPHLQRHTVRISTPRGLQAAAGRGGGGAEGRARDGGGGGAGDEVALLAGRRAADQVRLLRSRRAPWGFSGGPRCDSASDVLRRYSQSGDSYPRLLRLTKKRDLMWTKPGKKGGGTTVKVRQGALPRPWKIECRVSARAAATLDWLSADAPLTLN